MLVILLVALGLGALFFTNITRNSSENSLVTTNKSIISPNSLKSLSPTIEQGVEAYLNQSNKETTETRRERLSPFCSAISPMLTKSPNNLSEDVVASKAEVIEIEEVPTEGQNLTVMVRTQTTLLKNGQPSIGYQKYWLSMTMLSDRSWKAYDIGIIE